MHKVLLIEDDKFLQKAILDKFEKAGFEIIIADDGKIGIEKALEERPDFILLDLIMPVMSGQNALTKIKQLPGVKDIPVAILTAVPRGLPQSISDEDQKLVVGYWQKDQNNLSTIVENVSKYLEGKNNS